MHSKNFTLGGGTRLMLDLEHRMSDDIDIFLNDVQFLNFFNPSVNDTADEVCQGEYVKASEYIKLKRPEGQIDFICGQMLLPSSKATPHQETQFLVEPIAEVLAKKLYYRGAKLEYRDLFDWWAVLTYAPNEITSATDQEFFDLLDGEKLEKLKSSVDHLDSLYSQTPQEKWLQIRTHHLPQIDDAINTVKGHIQRMEKHLLPNGSQKMKI